MFNFKKPPDGWVISVDQTRSVDVELVLQKDKNGHIEDKKYDVWLKTMSPSTKNPAGTVKPGRPAKADIGKLEWKAWALRTAWCARTVDITLSGATRPSLGAVAEHS